MVVRIIEKRGTTISVYSSAKTMNQETKFYTAKLLVLSVPNCKYITRDMH